MVKLTVRLAYRDTGERNQVHGTGGCHAASKKVDRFGWQCRDCSPVHCIASSDHKGLLRLFRLSPPSVRELGRREVSVLNYSTPLPAVGDGASVASQARLRVQLAKHSRFLRSVYTPATALSLRRRKAASRCVTQGSPSADRLLTQR